MELIRIGAIGERVVEQKEARHYVGILLLFCTLVECWVGHFLWSLMTSQCLPEPIKDHLMPDRLSISARRELFRTLTGTKFGDAISDLTTENKNRGGNYLDYQAVWKFYRNVADDRNWAIHAGAIHRFPEDRPGKCIENIHGVNSLFIALHNRYIAKHAQS